MKPYQLRMFKPRAGHKSFRVYKTLPDGTWEHVVSEALSLVSDRYKRGDLSLAEATRLAADVFNALKLKRDREAGLGLLFFAESNLKVLREYEAEYNERESKAKSKRMRSNDLKRAVGLLGEVSLQTAERDTLVKKLKSHSLPAGTYNRMAGCINSLLKYLGRSNSIHTVYEDYSDITVWSEREILDLTSTLPEHQRLLCLTAFATGMRWGECIGLQPKQIKNNPKTGRTFVWVDRQWNRDEKRETPPKRGKKRDALVLPQYVDELRLWAAVTHNDRLKASRPKLPQYSFHTFRHSYATYLLQKGTSLSLVAKFLGNNIKVTEDYYAAFTFGDDLQLPDGL